ncbi:MAG: DNA topoisomerase VI subunit B [Sedimentisphaerales bacterium]|nr:DNA topoisomerase VI subunit B [Sedimentisphaerales bacterium]
MSLKRTDVTGQMAFAFRDEESKPEMARPAKKTAAKTAKAKRKTTVRKAAARKTATRKTAIRKATARKAAGRRTATGKPPARRQAQQVEQILDDSIAATARAMAAKQREISVSEFFAKNRHLLGFDNPRKALLTAVKEAVDNSLDACEEAQILPEIEVGVKATGEDRFRVWIQDNGPGIVKNQIPNIFGRLLYGSKFHSLRMARGQQGIGISAAGMYGLLTTGKNIKIISRTGPSAKAHYYELRIDTKTNRPDILKDEVIDWECQNGTRVEIELEARYQRGRQSVDEYLAQTAITNPHAHLRYLMPDGQVLEYPRTVEQTVPVPRAVKPHPYGMEVGVLMRMAKDTKNRSMTAFLCQDFSRVSARVSQEILAKAKLPARRRPGSLSHTEAEKLHRAILETKIMAPATSCIVPIEEDSLLKGLRQVVEGEFYTACSRPPAVYRGNPFLIEAALAYGGKNRNGEDYDPEDVPETSNDDAQQMMRVLRFANRVPLLYQQSACAVFKAIMQTHWRLYGLSQSRGALPSGPVTVMVHIASVWVPFTSESKEAVAHYPEIIKEIKLALAECGRALGRYLKRERRRREEALKRNYIEKYLPAIGEALRDILALKDPQVKKIMVRLEHVLECSRTMGEKDVEV